MVYLSNLYTIIMKFIFNTVHVCACAYVNFSHIASDQSQVHSARKQVKEELRGGGRDSGRGRGDGGV